MTLIEWQYKRHVRPRLFEMSKSDAEIAHNWGIEKLQWIQESRLRLLATRLLLTYWHPMLETEAFGLHFPNPFGLAAGYDKYCQVYWGGIPACGWGSVTVGGITGDEQVGNKDRPRMLRSEELEAIWNQMGFNNPGKMKAAFALSMHPKAPVPVGVNIGKSMGVPPDDLEKVIADYRETFVTLWNWCDYFEINVSSPNTAGLRGLQREEYLTALVCAVLKANLAIAQARGIQPKPVGVKIAPDLSDEELQDVIEVCRKAKVSAIEQPTETIAFVPEIRVAFLTVANTTISRVGCDGWDIPVDRGGVSGSILRQKARQMLRDCRRELNGMIPLISVGGISDGDELYYRLLEGANFCEAYTAWPFEGPDFVRRTLKTLVQHLKSDGFRSVAAAVGAYHR